ncbi:AAA family ATPase [Streptomyces sp. NPDC092369]|uniref:helix-turn-helix transcriptional regulator n=1 Tax=Streptomyces sp. NPDC092369 TaxID=3366015 RepID=UPI003805C657
MFMSSAQQMRPVPSLSIPGRQHEIGRLQAAWELCRGGRGNVVTLHGPVGTGRTELLDAFGEFAESDGAQVLMAAGSPLERDFPLGIVRQLFQSPHLAPEIVSEAARLIENGVAPAPAPHWSAPDVVEGGLRVRPTPEALHGLSTLLLDFARDTPLLLAVDDRQDADIPSLEFLLYLARRIRNARILTVLCSRENMTPPEPFFDVDLASQPHHERIRLRLFSREVIAELMSARLGEEAARRHAGTVHDLTGGNPLLVRAVIDDQEAGSVHPDLVVGENYRRGVMNCMHRIDSFALRVARGVAALGRPAEPALLAELLLLANDSPPRALYLLHAAGLFRGGYFRHPSGAGDLLAAMRPAELAALHRRAAELLRASGAPARHIAEQVRAAEGQVRAPWTATDASPVLTEDPQAAEPAEAVEAPVAPEADRPQEVVIQCVPWLPEADPGVAAPSPRRQRTRLRHLFWHGQVDEGITALHRYEAEHPADPGARSRLRDWVDYWYPALLPRTGAGADAERDRPDGARTTPPDGMRVLTALLGGLPAPDAVARAESVLRDSRLGETPVRSLTAALTVLLYADQSDRAARWCAAVTNRPGRGHDATEDALLAALTAEAALRQGDVRTAEEYARAAFQQIDPDRWGVGVGFPLSTMIAARTALDRHEDAARYLAMPVPGAMFRTPAGLHYRYARAGHRLAVGDAEAALAEYQECGETMARWDLDHLPGLVPWRIGAARAHLALGRPAAARALTDRQLKGLGPGRPRVLGMTLRTRAAAAESAERTPLLERAVQALEISGDQVELSAALAELSAAHGALGDPAQARTAERRARHLSRVSGTAPAEPGDDELSEAERRVAELAACGLTNREIGQKLFITVSTVEQHLTRVYRKLGVRRRMELSNLLELRRGMAG